MAEAHGASPDPPPEGTEENAREITVAEFPKNSRETVRIRLTTYQGHELIDVRSFYKSGGGWKPGKGIALRRALAPQLRKAIAAAEKTIKDLDPKEPAKNEPDE